MVPAFHWLCFVKGPPGSRQLPFGPRHDGLVCGQLYEDDRLEGPVLRLRFPVTFRHAAICFLAVLFPPREFRFPHGRPIGDWSSPPNRDGVPMFRTGEIRPVSGVSYTPGPWCSHGRHPHFSHHCRLPTAGPVLRCCIPSSEVVGYEAYRDSCPSPFRSSPCL